MKMKTKGYAAGGMMKTKGYKAGGKIKMVMKGGKKVPAFAADGVGKMATGGAVKKAMGGMKHGGKVSADMVSPRKAMAMGMKSGGKTPAKGR